MTDKAWRPPTAHQRSLVESWVKEWNAHVGDTAVVSPDLVARDSCGCGAWVAGLIAFELSPGEVEFEIYPIAGDSVSLQDATIEFEVAGD